MSDHPAWERTATLVTIESPWVRMLCERWVDDHGAQLEYWRVERPHSVIVVPLWRGAVLLPPPQFRPGLGRATLDLPGGRLPAGQTPLAAAPLLLRKELAVEPAAVRELRLLDERGWAINSSFNSQLLYGVVALLDDDAHAGPHTSVPYTAAGLAGLARELECLQCRAVVQELLIELAGVAP